MNIRIAAGLVATFLAIAASAQAPEPKLLVVYPQNGALVAGPVVIKASVEPISQPVERMRFMVDGQLICPVERPPFECTWNAGTGQEEHSIRIVAYLPGRQQPLIETVRTQPLGFADSTEVPIVQVVTSVTDGSKFITDLKREDFRLYDDDVQQRITFCQFAAENPLELITGVDVSGSMQGAIDDVKQNVKRFLSALRPAEGKRPADRVWVVGFNENFFIVANPSMDPPARLKAVDRLASWGMTSLYDIIIRSFDTLGQQQGARRGLVIFTDGDDTSSRVTREDVERRAQKSDAVLYLIGQGEALRSSTLRPLCERLATMSGGRAFFDLDLRGAFDAIMEELSNQYLIGYTRPEHKKGSGAHRIRVEVPKHPSYRVKHRQEYAF